MKTSGADGGHAGHDVLTEKQRLVLDLLIENKTSKEIARELGISPYTVDQRISLARGKLGVSSRSELAARYRGMRKIRDQARAGVLSGPGEDRADTVHSGDLYATSALKKGLEPEQHQEDRTAGNLLFTASPAVEKKSFPTAPRLDHRVGPKVFEGSHGGLWRLGAIVVTALLLVMTVLGLFAIFDQLNELLA